jgi:hypothetical protein
MQSILENSSHVGQIDYEVIALTRLTHNILRLKQYLDWSWSRVAVYCLRYEGSAGGYTQLCEYVRHMRLDRPW